MTNQILINCGLQLLTHAHSRNTISAEGSWDMGGYFCPQKAMACYSYIAYLLKYEWVSSKNKLHSFFFLFVFYFAINIRQNIWMAKYQTILHSCIVENVNDKYVENVNDKSDEITTCSDQFCTVSLIILPFGHFGYMASVVRLLEKSSRLAGHICVQHGALTGQGIILLTLNVRDELYRLN